MLKSIQVIDICIGLNNKYRIIKIIHYGINKNKANKYYFDGRKNKVFTQLCKCFSQSIISFH